MENAFPMSVPLDVEIGIGENWLEAHWFGLAKS
jgi:DNA polymerase-1